jgi:hypothetical protein
MTLFNNTRTNIEGSGEIAGRTYDAEGDYYHITDAQADHEYLQSKLTDLASILMGDSAYDYTIVSGGVVSDSGGGQVDVSECIAKGTDSAGNKRIIYIPALTNIALPTGWNDDRQIWVIAKYDFKLDTATRNHRAGTSYHYQVKDTYLGDPTGYTGGSTDDLFVDADPTGTAVILHSFKMNGSTYTNMNVRSPEVSSRTPLTTPSYDNILVKRNAGSAASKIDISWTEMHLGWMKTGARSFTLDITASGALGLDTGAEAADAWYYIWVIAKVDGTVSAILSASATAPTMPAGYTLKRLVSMVRNTSGNFVDFVQENDRWGYVASTAIKQVLTFINETLDCTIFIPESVIKADIRLNCYVTDSVIIASLYSYENGVYRLYNDSFSNDAVASRVARVHVFGTIGVSSRYIKYSTVDYGTATGVATNLWISGFEVPL